jgi:hypothetical protein
MLLLAWNLFTACAPGSVTLGDDDKDPAYFDTGADPDGDDTGADTDDTGADTEPTGDDTGDTDVADTDSADTGDTDPADTGEPPDTGSTPSDCVAYGFAADDSFDLAYGASVDAYDSTRGAWGTGNSSADATVAIDATSACVLSVAGTLSGSAWVGPGGDPATAACVAYGGSVSGSIAALPSALAMPMVALPAGMPASDGDTTVAWGETLTLDADTVVDDLTLAYGSRLEIDRSMTLVVRGALALDSAPIDIAAGATLDLYVEGHARVGWGAVVNGGGDPAQLRFHLLGTGGLSLDYGGALTAVVEQPDGAFTNGGGAFSGTWIGRSATSAWAATYHLDSSRLCP